MINGTLPVSITLSTNVFSDAAISPLQRSTIPMKSGFFPKSPPNAQAVNKAMPNAILIAFILFMRRIVHYAHNKGAVVGRLRGRDNLA